MKIFLVVALVAACISLPVANWFTERAFLDIAARKANDPAFKQFSRQLQVSCVDCHTPNLALHPFYSKLPIAKQIIDYDIEEAQDEFVIDQKKLSGEVDFTPKNLRKMRKEIQNDDMPLLQYKVIHWESLISNTQKKAMLDYIDRELHGTKTELKIGTEVLAPY